MLYVGKALLNATRRLRPTGTVLGAVGLHVLPYYHGEEEAHMSHLLRRTVAYVIVVHVYVRTSTGTSTNFSYVGK